MKHFFAILLILLITLSSFSLLIISLQISRKNDAENFYLGVTFSSNTTAEAKLLVERVKDYTNLFVVDSGPVSKNETMLNEICDYAVKAGLHILVYFGKFDLPWQPQWLDTVKQRWGASFLGVYFYDEPAGSLLDTQNNSTYLDSNPPKTYDDMADHFINSWRTMPGLATVKDRPNPPTTYTSDYALYWFDYLAGYNVLLAQFGWNHTRAQDIALVRGAAHVQNGNWGAVMTWTYSEAPYLENGTALYNDMVLAYEAGAKYIVVFNYPIITNYGVMQEEHFEALQNFWRDIKASKYIQKDSAEAVLVLPKNYGWGMRNPVDSIWGLWGPDEKSPIIWNALEILLARYGTNLDIVYDDAAFPLKDKYSTIYYWNSKL